MYGVFLSGLFSAIAGVGLYFKIRRPKTRDSEVFLHYPLLIRLLEGNKISSSVKAGKHSYFFKINSAHSSSTFQLNEVDGRLIVVWTLQSKLHGKRGKEWSFNKDYDQKKMYQEISSDLLAYEKTLFREN